MSTCPLQVRLWLTGPSCWLDVYLADITSRVLERVSCHAGGRVVTTNVTNKRDIDQYLFSRLSVFIISMSHPLCSVYLITFLIVFTICSTAVARPTNWLLQVRCEVMSPCQGQVMTHLQVGQEVTSGLVWHASQTRWPLEHCQILETWDYYHYCD